MASIDLSIELECEDCGATLDVNQRSDVARIYPCKDCMQANYDRGLEDGEEQAKKSN